MTDDDTTSEWAPGGEMSRWVAAPRAERNTPLTESQHRDHEGREVDIGSGPRRWIALGVPAAVIAVALGLAAIWPDGEPGDAGGTSVTDAESSSPSPSTGTGPVTTSTLSFGSTVLVTPTATESTVVDVTPAPAGGVTVSDSLDFGLSGTTDLAPVVLGADGVVHEVDLSAGSVRSTLATPIQSGAPAYMFADEEAIVVVAYDNVAGFKLDGDRTVSVISASDQPGGLLYLGPFADTAWEIDRTSLPRASATLIDLDAQPLGPIVDLADAVLLGDDGVGNLVVDAIGGTYIAGLCETSRLTSGELIGLGENKVLALECDERLVCGIVRRDRSSGDVTQPEWADLIDTAPVLFGRRGAGAGTLSPDGNVAFVQRSEGALAWVIVDLTTGSELEVPGPAAFAPIIWAADSGFAAYLSGERLRVYDRTVNELITIDDLARLKTMASNYTAPAADSGSLTETGTAFANGSTIDGDLAE